MLILTRKASEKIVIDGGITITVVRIKGNTVRLGIEAPRETGVLRAELPRTRTSEQAASDEGASLPDVELMYRAAHAACDEPAPEPRPVLSLQDWRARRRQQRMASSSR